MDESAAYKSLLRRIEELETRLNRPVGPAVPPEPYLPRSQWVYPCDPDWTGAYGCFLFAIDGDWDGGHYKSDMSKTLINLKSLFRVPSNARSVLVRMWAQDSGSSGGGLIYAGLSPNDDYSSLALNVWLDHLPDNQRDDKTGIVPCDENGNMYIEINSSGTDTMLVEIQIWGFEKRVA